MNREAIRSEEFQAAQDIFKVDLESRAPGKALIGRDRRDERSVVECDENEV